eukprot:m.163857 g.163857  ORF g.163857 m.163857 type:complete len:285 (+) comp12346_c0_seq1:55-909(+)
MGTYEDEVAEAQKLPKVESGSKVLRFANLLSFIVCVTINGLGSTGQLSASGQGVGEVSNTYNTAITPASYAFSIWGLIYFLLASFSIWQILPSQRTAVELLDEQMSWLFVASNMLNALWIVVFTQSNLVAIWFSCIILFVTLAVILSIMVRCELWQRPRDSWVEYVVVDAAFSIYAGWVTAASIVNASVALKGSGWNGSGFGEDNWSALMGAVAAVIYLVVLYRRKDGLYGLVYCWAATAILKNNPGSQSMLITYSICITLVAVASILSFYIGHRNRANYEALA